MGNKEWQKVGNTDHKSVPKQASLLMQYFPFFMIMLSKAKKEIQFYTFIALHGKKTDGKAKVH